MGAPGTENLSVALAMFPGCLIVGPRALNAVIEVRLLAREAQGVQVWEVFGKCTPGGG